MFSRILIGYDGSSEADAALALAVTLAVDDAPLLVVHVADWGDPAIPVDEADPHRGLPDDPRLRAAREVLGDRPGVEYRPTAGPSVGYELHRIARETSADLIVVGSSRHHGAGRVLLGSNTEATLHGAPCAVAVATEHLPARRRRVGVAFDGTPAGLATVAACGELVAGLRADLTVLGVVDTRRPHATFGPETGFEDVRANAAALLTEAIAAVQGVPYVHRQLHEGDPVHEILSLGRDSDLLVVGSRGDGPVLRLLLGSVSAQVVRRATCPVLVLPVDVAGPAAIRPLDVADPAVVPVASDAAGRAGATAG
jgi:nucleotide-binding universal stress UspA family protein